MNDTRVTFTVRSAPSACPRCGLAVERNSEGKLFRHQRYAPGSGYRPDQPHDLIWCEPESSETPR